MTGNERAAFLAEVREREQAATPGPWGWYGNSDVKDIYLATKRYGRSYVMRFWRWGSSGGQPMFAVGRKWEPEPEPQYEGEIRIRPHGRLTKAAELPVYEVAPSAECRTDPRVYRADLIGIRHPDAEFIAHAREDVRQLLAIIDDLTKAAR